MKSDYKDKYRTATNERALYHRTYYMNNSMLLPQVALSLRSPPRFRREGLRREPRCDDDWGDGCDG